MLTFTNLPINYRHNVQVLQKKLKDLQDSLSAIPNIVIYPLLWTYAQGAEAYLNTTEGKRLAYIICGINGAVWMFWQLPRLQPAMMRSFMHHPLSGLSYTMLTSMFR